MQAVRAEEHAESEALAMDTLSPPFRSRRSTLPRPLCPPPPDPVFDGKTGRHATYASRQVARSFLARQVVKLVRQVSESTRKSFTSHWADSRPLTTRAPGSEESEHA